MLVGYLRDTGGDYTMGFYTLIALALAGAVAVLFLPKHRIADAEPVAAELAKVG